MMQAFVDGLNSEISLGIGILLATLVAIVGIQVAIPLARKAYEIVLSFIE